MSLDWSVILPAGVGGIAIKAISDIIVASIRKRRSPSPDISAQFAALMQASESYREEVRNDMDRMRKDMDQLQKKYETDMSIMKEQYEKEISLLKNEVLQLTEEMTEYRRENGALHLLLKDRGIDPPHWIKRIQEK